LANVSESCVSTARAVYAGGAWAGRLAALLGDEIELGTKASMMIVTQGQRIRAGPTEPSSWPHLWNEYNLME